MPDLSSPEPPAGANAPEPNLIRWIKENAVPIVSLVCLMCLVCLMGHYSSVTIDWNKTKDFTDAFSNLTQGLCASPYFVAAHSLSERRWWTALMSPSMSGLATNAAAPAAKASRR